MNVPDKERSEIVRMEGILMHSVGACGDGTPLYSPISRMSENEIEMFNAISEAYNLVRGSRPPRPYLATTAVGRWLY